MIGNDHLCSNGGSCADHRSVARSQYGSSTDGASSAAWDRNQAEDRSSAVDRFVRGGAACRIALFRFYHLCPIRIVVRFPFARAVPAVNAFAQSAFSEQIKLGLDPITLASDPVDYFAGFAPNSLARVADSMPLVPCGRAVTLVEQFVHRSFRPAVRSRRRLERDRDVIGKPAGVDRDVGDEVAV